MSTAVATAPAAPVSVTDSTTGVAVTSAMTPLERHNAIAKSMGVATIERPVAPPQFHIDATVSTMVRQGAKLEAAKPATPAVPIHDPARVAAFDAEMQAKGLQHQEQQRNPDGTFAPGRPTVEVSSGEIQVDQAALDALNKAYRKLPPAEREAKRAIYQNDLKTLYEGRRLGETLTHWHARAAGAPGQMAGHQQAYVPGHEPKATPPAPTPQQWEEGHKSVTDAGGWIPHARINTAGLSGYTLPKLVANQVYDRGVFKMLSDARTAGFTQEQVNAYITAQMRRDGWIKT